MLVISQMAEAKSLDLERLKKTLTQIHIDTLKQLALALKTNRSP